MALLKQQPIRLSMLNVKQSDDSVIRSHELIIR